MSEEKLVDVYSLENGKTGIVKNVKAEDSIRQRLFDMGVLPNCEVKKERSAIGGNPVWIKVGNVEIALRRNEAESVLVSVAS